MSHNLITEQISLEDSQYMRRCIFLAQKGLGLTYPNPLVGCVIVYKGDIIGEGWHKKAGTAHAEVLAIKNVKDKSLLKHSTIYINLEPCSHYGKTPPCVDLILKYKIPRVVIASKDPDKRVSGKGIEKLKESKCEVKVGVLSEEAEFLNRRFYTFHQKHRPYIILKWAQTKDHFISPKIKEKGSIFWITGALAQQRAHQWRSEENAILVGVQTVIDDNPSLTTRHWKGNHPSRFVIDPHNRIPKDSKIMSDGFHSYLLNRVKVKNNIKQIEYIKTSFNTTKTILETLYKKNIQSIMVEGGAITLNHFLSENLWDEIRVLENPKKIKEGIAAPKVGHPVTKKEVLDQDYLYYYANHQ